MTQLDLPAPAPVIPSRSRSASQALPRKATRGFVAACVAVLLISLGPVALDIASTLQELIVSAVESVAAAVADCLGEGLLRLVELPREIFTAPIC